MDIPLSEAMTADRPCLVSTAPRPSKGDDSIDTSVDRSSGFDEDLETQRVFGRSASHSLYLFK